VILDDEGSNSWIIVRVRIYISLVSNHLYAEKTTYHVAFYSDFEPVSYSVSRDPRSPGFHQMQGYEYDLLKAMEKIPGANFSFQFYGVKEWNGLWISPFLHKEVDIAVGGIIAEASRTCVNGERVVNFTEKTLSFR
jgi:hypothetical protein